MTGAEALIQQGKAEGLEQGKAEGLEQGKAEGLEQGRIDEKRIKVVRQFADFSDVVLNEISGIDDRLSGLTKSSPQNRLMTLTFQRTVSSLYLPIFTLICSTI